MRNLVVFEHLTLDGYFTDARGDMSFAHDDQRDAEWDSFVDANASSGGLLLLGRITFELLKSYWPTRAAAERMPVVAEHINQSPKIVFSRSLKEPGWTNVRLISRDLVGEVRRLKEQPGKSLVILGSGSLVSQLAPHGVIDEYQFVLHPVVLGKGRTLFEGLGAKLPMTLEKHRSFGNGNTLVCYKPRS
jgi:dihydrofolate reductase